MGGKCRHTNRCAACIDLAHTQTHSHIRACRCTFNHTQTHTRVSTREHVNANLFTHTHTHTQVSTREHVRTCSACISSNSGISSFCSCFVGSGGRSIRHVQSHEVKSLPAGGMRGRSKGAKQTVCLEEA